MVLDHASTDATSSVISALSAEHRGRVTRLHEPDPKLRSMAMRQRLLDEGRRLGGTHFWQLDADEIVSANLVAKMRGVIETLPPGHSLRMPWINCWRNLFTYRRDASKHGKMFMYAAFADHPGLHWRLPETTFHHRNPEGLLADRAWPEDHTKGGLMHLQRAVWRRAQARQSLYKIWERLHWPHKDAAQIDRLYQASLDEVGAALWPTPAAWWEHGFDMGLIDLDAEPWEVGEVRRLLVLHGRERFAGLRIEC